MAASTVLGYGAPADTVDHVAGPLAMTIAIIALWEVTRPVRWAGVALGACLVIAPWVSGYDTAATLNSLAAGVALGALSFPKGRVTALFGGGWSSLWKRRDAGQS